MKEWREELERVRVQSILASQRSLRSLPLITLIRVFTQPLIHPFEELFLMTSPTMNMVSSDIIVGDFKHTPHVLPVVYLSSNWGGYLCCSMRMGKRRLRWTGDIYGIRAWKTDEDNRWTQVKLRCTDDKDKSDNAALHSKEWDGRRKWQVTEKTTCQETGTHQVVLQGIKGKEQN